MLIDPMHAPSDESDPHPSQDPPRSPARLRKRVVLAWVLVIAWALVIWNLGQDGFSARATSSQLLEWLRWLLGDLDPHTRYRILIGIRKSAHFVEYAILALLTFRAALITAPRHRLTSAAWIALFFVATLASADEARQAFSTVRTGSPYDVLLDIMGGAIGVAGVLLFSWRVRSKAAVRDPATPAPASASPEGA
jgi:VanZ family protein